VARRPRRRERSHPGQIEPFDGRAAVSSFWGSILLIASAFERIADAKKLLDVGTINVDEIARFKAKALA
jgi:hypothetical protein